MEIGKKILLIDDAADIRRNVRRFLEQESFIIQEAENGIDGLKIFHIFEPDLVIVDLKIPELDGKGVLFALKKVAPEVPVIIISGMAENQDLVEILRLGASDFITKPFEDYNFLIRSVKKALAERQSLLSDKVSRREMEEEFQKRTMELTRRNSDIEITNEALRRELLEHARIGKEMKRMRDGIINAIIVLNEKRDPYTAGHQSRVSLIAVNIARELSIDEDLIEGIRIAGLLHDIGKIAIPAEILNRPGKLKESEFNLIKDHPTDGYNILKEIDFPWPIAEIVYQHHEKLDGTGYPRGIGGAEILLEAKILSLADVIEAIASHRPYRPALGIDFALEEVQKKIGIHFDKDISQACFDLFRLKGFDISQI